MRKSADEKARSRERILDIAARRIRESGLEGPGVVEIMREAGMTHGGFYRHFASRDDLVLAATEHAFASGLVRVRELVEHAEDPLAAFVDWYVSQAHVADLGGSCAVATLSNDVARAEERVRAAYRAQVERYVEILEPLVGTRERARVALSTLVGSVAVARALGSATLAGPVLRDVRTALKASA